MNSVLEQRNAPVVGAGLGLVASPAIAHEGHVLDLVSAFLAPLAGWDHLLMAGLFVVVVVGMVRAMVRVVRRKTPVQRSDDQ
ncbi:MAG: HupE/UreJ family protein [Burkholderiaceae bacterium]